MPRYTPPSHYDERLVNGTLTFYETGTTTLKTVYSDVNLSTAIANPVSLGSLGEEPNIFFAGSARVIGKDSDGVQVFDRDPIGDDAAVGEFGAWDSNTVYAINDLVTGSNGNRYRSLQNTNQGNDPTLSPGSNTFWQEVSFISTWNSTITYSAGDVVLKDGKLYRSAGSSNLNNDPAVNDGNWLVGIDFLFDGEVTVNGRSDGLSILNLNSDASGDQGILRFRTNGVDRWRIEKDNSLETGSNAGSDLIIARYNDAGSFIGTAVRVDRATGVTTLADGVQGPNSQPIATRRSLQNPASQTIEGSLGNGANVTDITRLTRVSPTYTLDASTFATGDVVIVRNTYNTDLYGDITVTTDAGSIYLPDSTNAASHTMAGDVSFTVEFHKYDTNNWVVTIY